MKATIISDKDFHTAIFQGLYDQVAKFFNEKGIEVKTIDIGKDDLTFCMGCFGCWVKKPGECVIKDSMTEINSSFVSSDIVVYISPVIFGQFSANIKNALDRWLPNILPFFIKRPDGSTMHPSRYDQYPNVIIIGYGDNVSEEDNQLFHDITKKHKNNAEVIVYKNTDTDITAKLNNMKIGKAGGYL